MKTIAILCMLIDHIGMTFFESQMLWRWIGRLAMPIFAYCIARGAIYTHDIKAYQKRMLGFALISQIPFWGLLWAIEGGLFFKMQFNIGFTFLFALYALEILQKEKRSGIDCLYLIGIIGVAQLLGFDYGSYGIVVVLGCYFALVKGDILSMQLMNYTCSTLLFYGYIPSLFLMQEIGALGLVVVKCLKPISEKKLKYVFYIFYPLHLSILALIKLM